MTRAISGLRASIEAVLAWDFERIIGRARRTSRGRRSGGAAQGLRLAALAA